MSTDTTSNPSSRNTLPTHRVPENKSNTLGFLSPAPILRAFGVSTGELFGFRTSFQLHRGRKTVGYALVPSNGGRLFPSILKSQVPQRVPGNLRPSLSNSRLLASRYRRLDAAWSTLRTHSVFHAGNTHKAVHWDANNLSAACRHRVHGGLIHNTLLGSHSIDKASSSLE
jgi:hypothetical protein